ncbi:tubulin/FtsZ family protein [Halorussus gelatinilyticus]|uniref:Tubulin-like protein CetZ n=1 Tax=Halorussus gelatinilyticus TaxID=2937524 RepID=A0A8U0IFV6_9EURY|nr:tubulin/FtsZ family protein [Halorussus gelatinilyticus]UPV98938.1 tubulin/FtsZ family protein [Halorussus gelatinilyticus]
MKVAAIGVGGAGGRIVDELARENKSRSVSYLTTAQVLDTEFEDLSALTTIPDDACHNFGHLETHGTGTDGNRTSGIAAIKEDLQEVRREIESAIPSETTAIFVVAGLGGGTGSGATSHLVQALREIFEIPLYAVSVLPAGNESIPPENTARGLKTVSEVVDAQIVFDNDNWIGRDDTISENTAELNRVLAERLGTLFAAGEAETASAVGERVIDASEIIATLDRSGFATLGYAQQDLQPDSADQTGSLLKTVRERLFGGENDTVDEVKAIKAVETTLRRAVKGKLTLECDLPAVETGLLIVSGPSEWLHGDAIADGRAWLSEEIESAELRSGDAPLQTESQLMILVLLAGISAHPRIEDLQAVKE